MNDIATLKKLATEVKTTDKAKFDRVYNEVIYPRMVRAAEEFKENNIRIGSYTSTETHNKVVAELFGGNGNLQDLVETKMKPYLEQKGFKVGICSPRYYVYIRW